MDIMLKAIISLILVGIFLYLTITAIQGLMEAGEEVDRTEKAAQ
jgi:predicted Co/Zn/Cd cation transporter (cation efflux family)